MLKVLLKTAGTQIHQHLETGIRRSQFGFHPGVTMRDAIFALRLLCECVIKAQREIYLFFVYCEKVFGKLKHKEVIHILEESNIYNICMTLKIYN